VKKFGVYMITDIYLHHEFRLKTQMKVLNDL